MYKTLGPEQKQRGVAPARISRAAIASLLFGISAMLLGGLASVAGMVFIDVIHRLALFLCAMTSLGGLIFGVAAVRKIRSSERAMRGSGTAIAGICLAAFFTMFSAVFGFKLLFPTSGDKSQAQSVNCILNLKQLGLAARLWSSDHNGIFPPDFLSMSNELFTPKVLTCPGDPHRVRIEGPTWSRFDSKSITYEYLTPGIKEDTAISRIVVFRCPIHGAVCYGDGSVEQESGGREEL